MATVVKECDADVNFEKMHCQQKPSQSSVKPQLLDFSLIPIKLSCSRCPSPVKVGISIVQLEDGKYLELEQKTVGKVNCLSCNECVGVSLSGDWLPLEQALTINVDDTKSGWTEVSTGIDKKIHYVLSQIFYRELETPTSEQCEAVFDLPDPKDFMKILWINGAAIGFYTVKLKGTLVHETMDCYEMHTLDTAYIRAKHRRNGHGGGILSDLVKTFPNEDIGFSTPISKSMLRVIRRFLMENVSYRNRFWELNGTGGEGNQKIIWYTFNRS